MKENKDSKCGVCATPQFERNNYFYGKQFTVRDLLQEQSYFNQKRQLVNRMVLGWGVVCGLDVHWDRKKHEFVVETGMALDCCGHEIIVCEEQRIPFDDYDNQCRSAKDNPAHEGKFVLCLYYDECKTEPVELPAVGCNDEKRNEFNRIRDGFKLRLKKWEEACPKQPYDHVACLNRYKHDANESGSESPHCHTEDIHHYLCRKLKKGCPECEDCDCVVLATIYVRSVQQAQGDYQQYQPSEGYQPHEPPPEGYQQPEQPPGYEQQQYPPPEQPPDYQQQQYPPPSEGYEQQPPPEGNPQYRQQPGGYQQYPPGKQADYGSSEEKYERVRVFVDTCGNRRFVYNNSLLYDLIYCHHGDLPHIVDFSWRQQTYPTREVSVETFLKMMKDGLTVYFDQAMSPTSLNRHTFIVSYLLRDTGTGAFIANRIPVQEIKTDQMGNCYTATFVATERWINKELDAEDSELIASLPNVDSGVDVEITLRGSRIWSGEGKGLDGDYLADKLPTGNGTQGGDFVDWFRVMPPSAKKPKGKSYKEEF